MRRRICEAWWCSLSLSSLSLLSLSLYLSYSGSWAEDGVVLSVQSLLLGSRVFFFFGFLALGWRRRALVLQILWLLWLGGQIPR